MNSFTYMKNRLTTRIEMLPDLIHLTLVNYPNILTSDKNLNHQPSVKK